jgi:hypothetical protein
MSGRSSQALEFLRQQGYPKLKNVASGINMHRPRRATVLGQSSGFTVQKFMVSYEWPPVRDSFNLSF